MTPRQERIQEQRERSEQYLLQRFRDFWRQNWRPLENVETFECGHCGGKTASDLGLQKRGHSVVAICQGCGGATTFWKMGETIPEERRQAPGPLIGKQFNAESNTKHDVETVVKLYDEARTALSQGAASCSVLMCRKILMHIAHGQGYPKAKGTFQQYCEFLKDEAVVGRPLHALLDKIKDAGNTENHKLVCATYDEAHETLRMVEHLIESVYFLT